MKGGDNLTTSSEYEENIILTLLDNGITTEITDKQSLQRAQSFYSDIYVDLAFSSEDNENLIVDMEQRLNESIKKHLMDNDTSLYVQLTRRLLFHQVLKKLILFK